MPDREKRRKGRVRSRPVRSLVLMHAQTAAKPRGLSRSALGFTAETDSLLEQTGFELSVPRDRIRISRTAYVISA